MEEIWKPIPGFDGYEVSNFGNVRSFKRNNVCVLKPSITSGGYLQVNLCKNGKVYPGRIHKLVLLAFVGPRPEGLEICHGPGGPSYNRLDNLRYDTHIANMQETKRASGPSSLGSKIERKYLGQRRYHRAKRIRSDFLSGVTKQELAERYNTSMSNICHIVSRI